MNADELLRRARESRCLLHDLWDEGSDLSGREQLALANGLAAVKPASIEKNGRRIPCEPVFELRPKERRRLVEALLVENVGERQILAVVPGLLPRTFRHIKTTRKQPAKSPSADGFPERQFREKQNALVPRPWTAYRDATSGANLEAEEAFRNAVAA